MPEDQNIEYKQSWQEDNLKTVCALANSQGGTLFIDKGAIFNLGYKRTENRDSRIIQEKII